MKIQPRQQLLEIWRAASRKSFQNGEWVWGGRHENSSISDAEQLLCFMLPATETLRFRLDRPDETDIDVKATLRTLGDAAAIPRRLIHALSEYMQNYTDKDGAPTFPGGSYLTSANPNVPPDEDKLKLDTVESFAASVKLTLATIGFCRTYRASLTRPELVAETTELEEAAAGRLTAAMVGLLRSFSINVFETDHAYGENLQRTVNQENRARRAVLTELEDALDPIRAGLRDYISIGSGQSADLARGRMFECGWSWGVIADAPDVSFAQGHPQRTGHALDAPYLYFTVVALDGIADLFSQRTRLLGLLNDEQQRLARALEIRYDQTQAYWAVIASFGGRRWPLEDIPWRTVDGEESDYFSLLVTAIAARDLAGRREENDADLGRLARVLTELANRGRITRRPFPDDPAVGLHSPGVTIGLEFAGEEDGVGLVYEATDFASLLLKRVLAVATFVNDIELRGELLDLADRIWEHVVRRKLTEGEGRDLWDQPASVFPGVPKKFTVPTWHHTLRVVESLVLAAELANSHPLRSSTLAFFARDMLAEADHLFDKEQLRGTTEAADELKEALTTVRHRLAWVRQIVDDRPGSAVASLVEILSTLDRLAAARSDVGL
jgi:hypothetical protein